MQIRESLQHEHSKSNTEAIVAYIGNSPKRLKELLAIFAENDIRLTQRASWPLMYLGATQPKLLQPHLKFFIGLLKKPLHNGVKRNVLRLLQDVEVPESLAGEVADYCFHVLRTPEEPIAVQAFGMTVLFNLCKRYPELKHELALCIEDMMPYGSPAIKNRGGKILNALNKI